MQTGERVRILQRFVCYTGAGILAASVVALAIRFWLPESFHMPLYLLVYSICVGVALMLLVQSVGRVKTGPALHKVNRTNQLGEGMLH